MTSFATQYFHECHIGNACRRRQAVLFDLLDSRRCVLKVAEDMVPVLIFKSHNKRLQTDALSPGCRAAQCLQILSQDRQRAVKMRLLDDGAFSRPIVAS